MSDHVGGGVGGRRCCCWPGQPMSGCGSEASASLQGCSCCVGQCHFEYHCCCNGQQQGYCWCVGQGWGGSAVRVSRLPCPLLAVYLPPPQPQGQGAPAQLLARTSMPTPTHVAHVLQAQEGQPGGSKAPSDPAVLTAQRLTRSATAGARAPRPYTPAPGTQGVSAGADTACAFYSCVLWLLLALGTQPPSRHGEESGVCAASAPGFASDLCMLARPWLAPCACRRTCCIS